MADIELVIKIDEKLYSDMKSLPFTTFAEDVIINGTPLPKEHGRLKDTDAICKDIISALGIHDENYPLEAEKVVHNIIKNASIIMEENQNGQQ